MDENIFSCNSIHFNISVKAKIILYIRASQYMYKCMLKVCKSRGPNLGLFIKVYCLKRGDQNNSLELQAIQFKLIDVWNFSWKEITLLTYSAYNLYIKG